MSVNGFATSNRGMAVTRGNFIAQHLRLFAFFSVLLLASGLTLVMFQEARAVSVEFSSPPSSIAGTGTFPIDIIIPNGQRVPITAVDAVIEKQLVGRSDKVNAQVVSRARCPFDTIVNSGCPTTQPLTVLGGPTGVVTSLRFVGAFAASSGAELGYGYFDFETLSGTRTGYGYDTVSPVFTNFGYGYGYGYTTGDVSAFNIGNGYGYGYGTDGLRLRFEIDVLSTSLSAGVHYLTVLVQTGSGVIGELSSPFTQFTVSGSTFTVQASVAGNTASAALNDAPANAAVNVPLSTLSPVLGTLTLNTGGAAVTGQVTVQTSDTPLEGALAIPTGFTSVLHLSITPPAGVTSGQMSFTLSAAQLAGRPLNTVALMHFKNGVWQTLATTAGGAAQDGSVTFTAQIPSFSAFAVVFTPAVSGGGGGGGGAGAAGPSAVTPSVTGSTATAALTNAAANSQVAVPLSTLSPTLGTLTLNVGNSPVSGTVTVTTSTSPVEGAIAVPSGFGTVLYLSITPPAGVTTGALTFTLTRTQLGADSANSVTLTHFKDGVWQSRSTTPGTPAADGSITFTAQIPSFSAFAIVFDREAPSVDGLRPADGGSATTRPVIAASLRDNRGINTAVTRLFVDGQPVAATVSSGEILYTPPVALTVGTHTVRVQATDLSGLTTERSWSFTAAQAADAEVPTVEPRSPPAEGFTNNRRPVIAADFRDNLGIDITTVTLTLDGVAVTGATVTGTAVTFTPATDLADGPHTVQVTAADNAGNGNFALWTFTVDTENPRLTVQSPARGASVPAGSPLRVTYADVSSGVDPSKVVLTLDGRVVQVQATATELTYTLRDPGPHTAKVVTTDRAGNEASTEWTFTVSQASGGGLDLGTILVLVLVIAIVGVGGFLYWKKRA